MCPSCRARLSRSGRQITRVTTALEWSAGAGSVGEAPIMSTFDGGFAVPERRLRGTRSVGRHDVRAGRWTTA